MGERRDGLYGRRKGKPLSPRKTTLMATALPALAIDTSQPAPADLGSLFPHRPAEVRLEIGFGGGEHLAAMAMRFPDTGFIGVEPFVNGLAKMVTAIADDGLANVRLFGGEAQKVLDWLPPASLAGVDLLYPDPWPKKRHWKRRFVSAENFARLARVMRGGAILRVASDIPDYVTWTLMHAARAPEFAWTAERASDWTEPYEGWPGTRYEAKALAAGRTPTYLTFRRG